jgi:tetratricopeptide (TPR) repeat protein
VATALILDYTPLPPASRTERPSRFQREPARNIPVRRPGLVTAVAVVGSLATVALLVSLLITNWGTLTAPASPAQAAVTPTASILDQYEVAIAQAKQAAEQNPTSVDAWLQYANQLYDSAQIVRENMPDSSLYQQRIPRWLEASAAYSKVLEIEPGNISALSDKGTSLCYYGAGVGDQAFITEGIKNVREAATARADDPLIQLNLGTCLVSALPPQTAEAIQTWQKVVKIAPVDSALAQRARELIDKYQKK